MKVCLSRYYKNSFRLFLFLQIGTLSIPVYLFVNVGLYEFVESGLYGVFLGIMPVLAIYFIMECLLAKLQMDVVIEKDYIQSYWRLNSRLKGCVDLTENVYYVIFHTPQGGENACFIALSNQFFEYRESYGIMKIRFAFCYDWRKIVLLPWNSQIQECIKLSKEWTAVK